MISQSKRIASKTPINQRSLLTENEAASYLSMCVPVLNRLCAKHKIKKKEVGGKIKWRRADLDELVDAIWNEEKPNES